MKSFLRSTTSLLSVPDTSPIRSTLPGDYAACMVNIASEVLGRMPIVLRHPWLGLPIWIEGMHHMPLAKFRAAEEGQVGHA